MQRHVGSVAWVVAWFLAGCAFGAEDQGEGSANDGAWVPGDTASSGDTGEADDKADDAADDTPGDDGEAETGSAPGCDAGCDAPPGDCFEADSGACEDGVCTWAPKLAGEICSDDCGAGGFCDASGTCICSGDDAGTGGMSEECDATTCVSGPNSSAACDDTGQCIVTCESPYEDCDGDPTNGCEVPVGVPHMCDSTGINPGAGCWTAYCGNSGSADAANFGSYYCMDCPTCSELAGGQCHWCNHDTGNFYPSEVCACGAQYLDAACGG